MKALVVANWKMNPPTWREAKKLLDATKKAADKAKHVSVVICPPSIYLRDLKLASKSRRIAFGIQHAHELPSGAHTGDISMMQAADSGATYVIVGHAERRAQGESNEDTGRKLVSALAQKITPVLCIGEKERTLSGEHFNLVRTQLRQALADVSPAQVARVIVVYEPLWTIGKDIAMSPRDMHEMAIFIRKAIVDQKGEAGMNVKVLYGGSIDETSASEMLRFGDVAGLLVGRAAETPDRVTNLLLAIEDAQ